MKTLNMALVKSEYMDSGFQTAANGFITYGQVSTSIGYIHISSFSNRAGKNWVTTLDSIVGRFLDNKGLILDVRNNPGGDARNTEAIVGRFADRKRVSSFVQIRNGPRHSDFGPLKELYVMPTGNRQYTKSIVVLTDGTVASAAEYFVLAIKRFPYVTVIGAATRGSLTDNRRRELPNGWIYRMSIGKWYSADHVLYEAVGIPPDVRVPVPDSEEPIQGDVILDTAIEFLN